MEDRFRFSEIKEHVWSSINLPNEVVRAWGMLSVNERKLLCYLARDYFTGEGTIVDAGAFLGASALSLACGLRSNPRCPPGSAYIHSFDNFITDSYTHDFLHHHLKLRIEPGASFRPLFEEQIEEFKEHIVVHDGDFHQHRWFGPKVEILFVDICKSVSLNSHLIGQLFSFLIPGVSVIVHQDYHHPHLPWIHVTMEYLNKYLRILEERVEDSIVFGLAADISPQDLGKCVDFVFSDDEQLSLITQAIERLSPENRHVVELARVVLLTRLRRCDLASHEFERIISKYENLPEPRWATYLTQVRLKLHTGGQHVQNRK
jgi:hypothetical protein